MQVADCSTGEDLGVANGEVNVVDLRLGNLSPSAGDERGVDSRSESKGDCDESGGAGN